MKNTFGPTARWDKLALRAKLLARLRQFFDQRSFLEVETPLLSADTVVDRHLDPLPVTVFADARTPQDGRRMWLQTSPELGMKRLLASGSPPAIYQITRAFRGGEHGPLHNPEFTMVEWYRVNDDYRAGIELLADLAKVMLECNRVLQSSYRDVFIRTLGVDPLSADVATLIDAAQTKSSTRPPDFESGDRDSWLDFLLTEFVEPNLGRDCPEIVYDYPASQAALARVRHENPPVAERFELYANGIELANGYHELLDASVLRQRMAQANAQRQSEGKYTLPMQHQLLDAMEAGLPPCTGVALGFDRLVMVACGASNLSQVMAFPIDRA